MHLMVGGKVETATATTTPTVGGESPVHREGGARPAPLLVTSLARLSLSSISCLPEESPALTSSSPFATSATGLHPLAIMSSVEAADGEVATKIEEGLDEDDESGDDVPDSPLDPSLDRSPGAGAGAGARGSADPAGGGAGPAAGPPKRPRGRPRKHPLPSPDEHGKNAKGRSKTGCITCRRRKKKCDETKPHCLNCQKNAVMCEGYPERVMWKSGRQRAEEARAARAGTRPQELPVLVDGIETEVDRILLDHFTQKARQVTTLFFREDTKALQLQLLPLAIRHKGLMHALLVFSASHLSSSDHEPISERQHHHYLCALHELRTDTIRARGHAHAYALEAVDDPTVAAALVLCLDMICSGATDGQYRPHLAAAKQLMTMSLPTATPGPDVPAFGDFLIDFFAHHDTIGDPTTVDRRSSLRGHDFPLPLFIVQRGEEDRAFRGVFDGLYDFVSRITKLREEIRARRQQQVQPLIDYPIVCDAVSLDVSIRSWANTQPRDSNRFIAAQLYRQCAWIYLWRTVQRSRATAKIVAVVNEGLTYLRQLPPDASTQSILLLPVFMLGCAAFEPEQRPELRKQFGLLKRYSSLKNIEPARDVVEKVWAIMDQDDGESAWDWERIIQGMGYDFLAT
ncbi:MAG: hypothetical protein M1826_003097 [Phylliscum demangeonii]|nr:MAG: hypothetical protein M1826_003097 [Phylliscum demangeonii]